MVAVAFVAPFLAPATLQFLRAVANTPQTQCALITQEPKEKIPEDLRQSLAGHWRIGDALNADHLVEAVRGLQEQLGPITRLLGILEQAQVAMAEARVQLGIPGMSPETAHNFRDKAKMKTVLRQAGLPCAKHALASSTDVALRFASEVGFPIIVKPPDGAGAKATHRVEDVSALRQAVSMARPSETNPVLLEEFVTGREFSFDSVFVDGQPKWHSFSHYEPTPLQVLENPWIQWCVMLPRHIDDPQHEQVRGITERAVSALGMQTGLSHMEWFLRPNGAVAISEVGARPPGAQFTTLLSYAHDVDFYKIWASLVVHGQFDPPPRKYAVGAAYLRGSGGSRVTAVHGLEEAQKEIGAVVVEATLPKPGQAASGTYEGDGCVIVRHEETRVVKEALKRILELIRVEMS